MHDYFFLCPEATRKGIFREDHKMEKEINKMAHRYKENGRLEAVFQVSSFRKPSLLTQRSGADGGNWSDP